jgi:hypothetical protein
VLSSIANPCDIRVSLWSLLRKLSANVRVSNTRVSARSLLSALSVTVDLGDIRTSLTTLLSRRRCLPFTLTALGLRGRPSNTALSVGDSSPTALGHCGSGGYTHLANDAALTSEVLAVYVDRSRSSWTALQHCSQCWRLFTDRSRSLWVWEIHTPHRRCSSCISSTLSLHPTTRQH